MVHVPLLVREGRAYERGARGAGPVATGAWNG